MIKLEISKRFIELYEKDMFVVDYETKQCKGYLVGESRKETVLKVANSLVSDVDNIQELLEAVYDAGMEESK